MKAFIVEIFMFMAEILRVVRRARGVGSLQATKKL